MPGAVFDWSVVDGAEQIIRYKGDGLHWNYFRGIDWPRDVDRYGRQVRRIDSEVVLTNHRVSTSTM
jgi:hypothetical protein